MCAYMNLVECECLDVCQHGSFWTDSKAISVYRTGWVEDREDNPRPQWWETPPTAGEEFLR